MSFEPFAGWSSETRSAGMVRVSPCAGVRAEGVPAARASEGVALSEEASSAPGPPLQPESRASPTTTASSGREAAVGTISP